MPPAGDHFSTSTMTTAPLTFFNLPAEVRNTIYRLVFPKMCEPIKPNVPKVYSDEKLDALESLYYITHIPARILPTSRSFNLKAAPSVYGTNTFYLSSLDSATYFIKRIGKQNSAYITSLRLSKFWYPGEVANSPGFKDALETKMQCLTKRCPRLSSFEIGVVDLSFSAANQEWKIATLGYLKILIDALPELLDVRYSETYRCLHLGRPTVLLPYMVRYMVRILACYLDSYH